DPDPMGCGERIDTVKYVRGDAYKALQAECEKLKSELDSHKAARLAYASEFPLDGDGNPDVGSIHQNIRTLKAECDALRAKTSLSLGVGDGTGNLFVHGDYESIKRAQALIFECGKLRKDVDMLVDALKCLYDAINSCIELPPDIMRKAEAALAPHRKQGGG